jgi:superfamily I DNA/RNA helicase
MGYLNLYVHSDPDQAIYGFRGADIANFYRFTTDFKNAREITLQKITGQRISYLRQQRILERERPLRD